MRRAARGAVWLAAAVSALASPSALAAPVDRWAEPIAEASLRFGIPGGWIRRVIDAESAGRTNVGGRPIRSRAGAIGLMQLMPRTWRAMRARHGLGPDPDNPRDNILAGTAYLREMYQRFGYPGLFAAYNSGPARYEAYLNRGARLPAETVAYVAKVAGRPLSLSGVATSAIGLGPILPPPTTSGLFAGPAGRDATARSVSDKTAERAPSLFFRLSGQP